MRFFLVALLGLLACTSASYASSAEKEVTCLAQAIYYEARGEPKQGRLAVGQVVLNRVEHGGYPKSVCGVVFQNKHLKNRCQFSFACDGNGDLPRASPVWQRSKKEANDLYACDASCRAARDSEEWSDPVWSSTHYHANHAHPSWALKLKRTASVGQHTFYRDT